MADLRRIFLFTLNGFTFPYLIVLVTVLAWGCVSKHVILDRAIIRNETGGVVSQVRVSHEPGKMGEVHSILPNSAFELGFSEQPLLEKRSVITWTGHDGRQYKAELKLPYAETRKRGDGPMNLIYTIHQGGIVTVELEE